MDGIKEKRKQVAKIFFFGFLVILVLQFVLNFVNIGQTFPTGYALLDFQKDIIIPWQEGALNIVVARWLFFILGIIFIYALLGMILQMNPFLRFFVGAILSFLFIGYVLPGELLALTTAYGAAGLTAIAIIPFVFLMFFTASILTQERMGAGAAILERFLWFFFFIFLVYKVIGFWGSNQGEIVVDNGVMIILLIVTFLSFAVFIWHKLYLQFITNTLVSAFSNIKAAIAAKKRTTTMELANKNQERMRKDFDDTFGTGD